MKREVLKLYLIITFFLFFSVIIYYLYENRNNIVKDNFVTFSKESGFYDNTIEIKLKKNIDLPIGTKLYYTLNGDDPTFESNLYKGKIKLEVVENEMKVYPLKVRAFYKGNYSDVQEKTYIIDKNIDDIDLKIISISANNYDLYDYYNGILSSGFFYDQNAKNGMRGFIPGNYNQRGEEWERPAIVQIFDTNGNLIYDKKSGIAVSGNTSTIFSIKSLKMIANKYDDSNKVKINFYKDKEVLNNSNIYKYNTLRFRSGSQDMLNSNLKSSFTSRLANDSNFDGCTTTERALLFLNGDFYGIRDIQQSYTSSFLGYKFNIDSSKIIKVKGAESMIGEVFSEYYETKNREDIEKYIDMDNYLLYYSIEILLDNTDWPQNSFETWKYTGEYLNNNKYTDGKYRFLLFDTDMLFNGNVFIDLMENINRGENSSFRIIMESKYYRDKYIMLTQDLMNTTFDENNEVKIVDEESNKIRNYYEKFYSEDDYNNWSKYVDSLKENIKKYNNKLKNNFKEYFGVDETHNVKVKANEGIQINFSNQELYQNMEYSNDYYIDIDLRYTYKSYPGYKFSYWIVNGEKVFDDELVIESDKYNNIDEINIEAVAEYQEDDNHLLISEIYAKGDSDWIKITNTGKKEIYLKDYYLSNNEKKLLSYELPNIILKPNESIIINGDKNYYSIGDYICNFNLKEDEKVILSKNNIIIDSIIIPKMSEIETYGRYINSNTYKYFLNENNERKK